MTKTLFLGANCNLGLDYTSIGHKSEKKKTKYTIRLTIYSKITAALQNASQRGEIIIIAQENSSDWL